MVGFHVNPKTAIAITLVVTYITGLLVWVVFVLNVKLQMAPAITHDVTLWTGEMAAIRGFMSFPATFSIITGSSLEMVTNWSCFLKGGRVDGGVDGRVDGRVWRGGGSVTDGHGNFIGIFTDFNFAMFFQHMHF